MSVSSLATTQLAKVNRSHLSCDGGEVTPHWVVSSRCRLAKRSSVGWISRLGWHSPHGDTTHGSGHRSSHLARHRSRHGASHRRHGAPWHPRHARHPWHLATKLRHGHSEGDEDNWRQVTSQSTVCQQSTNGPLKISMSTAPKLDFFRNTDISAMDMNPISAHDGWHSPSWLILLCRVLEKLHPVMLLQQRITDSDSSVATATCSPGASTSYLFIQGRIPGAERTDIYSSI